MTKITIKDGIARIDVRERFNPGIKNFEMKNALDLFLIFGLNGTRLDTEIIDIDLFDETKAFDYDFEGKPVLHCGSFCNYDVLFYSIREFVRQGKNSNVTAITFDIHNKETEGELNINSCRIETINLYEEDLDISSTDLEHIWNFV